MKQRKLQVNNFLKKILNYLIGPGGYNIKPMFADVPKYLLPNK
jgi:hypothetical protein